MFNKMKKISSQYLVIVTILILCVVFCFDLLLLKHVPGTDKKAAVLETVPGFVAGAITAFLLARWQLAEEKRTRAKQAKVALRLISNEIHRNRIQAEKIVNHFEANTNEPTRWQLIMADLAKLSDKKYLAFLNNSLDTASDETIKDLELAYNSMDIAVNELTSIHAVIDARGDYSYQRDTKPGRDSAESAIRAAAENLKSNSIVKFMKEYPPI